MYSILVIGGDQGALAEIRERLRQRRYLPQTTTSASEGLRTHREEGADLVLVALPLQDTSGSDLLKRLRSQDPRAIVVVCGHDEEVKGAPEALKLGAFEYLSDPLQDINALLSVVSIGLGARKSDVQLRFLRKKDAAGADWVRVVCECPAMRRVFSTVRQIGHRTASGGAPTILVTGETGTGKGLIAKTIHYNSARRSRAFVDINCAAIPPSLIEAEVFGHARGAFTDARSSRAGLFETADGGTFFLDEIGALPLELQAKLLTVIEEKTVRRLGTAQGIHVDVQIIAATSRDLESMMAYGAFRSDLYHRLKVVTIELPPLRERGEDKVLLAREFIRTMCREYGIPEKELADDAQKAVRRYGWPGNVRELRNQIERIVLLEDDEIVRAQHFVFATQRPVLEVTTGDDTLDVRLPEGGCSLEALEREVIRKALEKHQGNVSRTARYLGISRHTLIYRLKKHRLTGAV